MRTVIYRTLYRLLEESSEKIFGTMMGALHKLYKQLSVPAVSRKSLQRCLLMELCYTSLLSSQNVSSSPTLCSSWYLNSLLVNCEEKLRSSWDYICHCCAWQTKATPLNRQHGTSLNYGHAADKEMPKTMADGCYGKLKVYSPAKARESKPPVNQWLPFTEPGVLKHRRTYQRKILYGPGQERRRRRGRGGV